MLLLFFILLVVFLYHSKNLLLSLLVLEALSFFVMFHTAYHTSVTFDSDFVVLSLFAVFVMEGVIALSGLILLVRFTGSDYIRSSSLLKL